MRLALKIRGRGSLHGIPFEKFEEQQDIQWCSTGDQTELADSYFLLLVFAQTPSLTFSAGCFWFWLSQTKKQHQGEIGFDGKEMWLT